MVEKVLRDNFQRQLTVSDTTWNIALIRISIAGELNVRMERKVGYDLSDTISFKTWREPNPKPKKKISFRASSWIDPENVC